MPVILTPVPATVTPGTPSCTDELLLRPTDKIFEGCPVRTQQRVLIAKKGINSVVEWEMRDPSGQAVNLNPCLNCDATILSANANDPGCGQVIVRLQDCFDNSQPILQQIGYVTSQTDAGAGKIRVALPDLAVNQAGLFWVDFGITNSVGQLVVANRALLSIERTLFGDTGQTEGPLDMQEIRDMLLDTVQENTLYGQLEFSDNQIVHSILDPLQEWNETPPPLYPPATAASFPYRYHWKFAVIANLLMAAANNYRRNKLMSQAGGIAVNDKDRDIPYMQTAMAMRQEWKDWLIAKKVEINCQLATGTVGSTYWGRFY